MNPRAGAVTLAATGAVLAIVALVLPPSLGQVSWWLTLAVVAAVGGALALTGVAWPRPAQPQEHVCEWYPVGVETHTPARIMPVGLAIPTSVLKYVCRGCGSPRSEIMSGRWTLAQAGGLVDAEADLAAAMREKQAKATAEAEQYRDEAEAVDSASWKRQHP